MRHLALVPLAASLGLLASIPMTLKLAEAVPAAPSIMPLSEIKVGMKGYGLSVFRGTEPERFDVEVLGVMHQFRPHQDLVLVRTSHPRLEVAKVVAGMSGSPIFIQDRMIGAYAYGWQFVAEPIAGVTPIQSMLDELARPVPAMKPIPLPGALGRAGAGATGGARGAGGDGAGSPSFGASADGVTFDGKAGAYDLREHARQLAKRRGAAGSAGGDALAAKLVPVATPVLLGGFGDGAARMARDLLEPLGLEPMQAGGAGQAESADAPTRYVNGGAIAIQMVTGDVSVTPLGTVTRVEGDRLVAFGHPMMNAGISALPAAVARVLWVLASQARSFKIGEAVRPLGALVNDRQAAIVVDAKSAAPTFPATVDVEGVDGAPHHHWSYVVAHDQFMSPSFVALAVGSAVEATTSERRDVTWSATTDITVAGFGTTRVTDGGIAVGGTPDTDDWGRSRAVRAVGAILNNPWQLARIEKIATKIQVRFARDAYRLRGADALADVLDAGQPARIRLHLVPFAGPEEQRIVEVPVPRELAGKDVEIELSPGYNESPELPSPDRLADLIANLPQQSYPLDSIVASIKLPEHGVTFHGQVAGRLPPGALDMLRPLSDTEAPEPFVSHVRTAIPLRRFVEGKDRVHVHIRPVLR